MLNENTKKELIDLGYLKETAHSNGELFIYNYTQAAQFDKECFVKYPILKDCRGLILDKEGYVIAKSFPKFWNYEEYGLGSVLGELPFYRNFEITDKLDGSLIIVTSYKGELIVATRGSFQSEQALWAKDYLLMKHPFFVEDILISNWPSVLFECIYPENRIVVNYGEDRKLILLSVIDKNGGVELCRDGVQTISEKYSLPIVNTFDGIKDFATIREQLPRTNAEGFVVKFDNGLRVKLKYEEYVRLHRIVTGVSSKSIWDLLRNGQPLTEIIENVPDEFLQFVKDTEKELRLKYLILELDAKMSYLMCKDLPTRKDKALYLMQHAKELSAIVFKMLDKRSYSGIIWDMIKPEFKQPFKNNEEE